MGPPDLLRRAVAPALVALALGVTLPLPAGAAGPGQGGDTGQDATEFRVRASPGLEEMARRLVADEGVRAPLPGIGELAGAFGAAPTVWVVRTLAEVPGAPFDPEGADWVAGFADSDRNLVAVRASDSEGRGGQGLEALGQTLRHELAHLALEEATGGRAPRWLHEGYAQLAAGSWNWEEAWRLRFVFFREGGGTLEELSLRFPRREDRARVAYMLSYTAVQELASLSGPAGLRGIFDRLHDGEDMDAAVRSVFGLTLDRFEERWRERVRDRYGWLYFLSRASMFWVALTLALLLLGWRRWRYDRRRMEALRRQDTEGGKTDRDDEPDPWGIRRPRRSNGEPRGTVTEASASALTERPHPSRLNE